ncbi:MAG: hypothetical protein ACRDI2_13675, partial [Chloroflexota bacterium]
PALQCLVPIDGGQDAKAFPPQGIAHQVEQVCVVVDKQYFQGRSSSAPPRTDRSPSSLRPSAGTRWYGPGRA